MRSRRFWCIAEATHASQRAWQVNDFGLVSDSLELGGGLGSLFFCCRGANFDGEIVRATGTAEGSSSVAIRAQAKEEPISANVKGSLNGSRNFTVNQIID